jgi:hypothetical protein
MQGTLLLAILTVRSSYAGNTELPLTSDVDVPDTLQWWVAETGTWRIRTYAIDHNIHTHQVDGKPDDLLALARQNNRKHYGDVLKAEYSIKFADCHDQVEVRGEFERVGIDPRLEVAAGQFAFWKPDDARYSTKSEPKPR